MIVSIHQPAYLPWLTYFAKIAQSDTHIFFDDAKYSKNNLFNRNKIKTPNGWQWLTVPVHYKSDTNINQIKIDNTKDWQKKHWATLQTNYLHAPYFKEFSPFLKKFYTKKWLYLSDLTISMNKEIIKLLKIKVKFVKSSKFKTIGKKNEKLINLCKTIGSNFYLSGQGAKNLYMNEALFAGNNIKVIYQNFNQPIYKQLWGEFIPNLSIVDYLFNCGVNSCRKILSENTNK